MKMKMKILAAVAAMFVAMVASDSMAATLTGKTITADYIFGANGNAVFATGTNGDYVVGPGVEFTTFGVMAVDFDDTTITFTNVGLSTTGFFGDDTFNGFRITDTSGTIAASFTNFFIASSTFDNAGISAFEDVLFVNFLDGSSVASNLGDQLVVQLSTSPVPIPASLPLLAVGLGGLGYMARRKRKAS